MSSLTPFMPFTPFSPTPSTPFKVVFMGTPAFAVPTLQALLATPWVQVVGVLTQPDKAAGRGQQLTASPVKTVALQAQLPVLQPTKLREDESVMAWLETCGAHALVTIAFGQILPARVLQATPLGTINVHASLLPAYRGANPIQWALLDGLNETGLTTMRSDEGVDTGPMLLKATTPIEPEDTTGTLAERMAAQAPALLLETLQGLAEGTLCSQPQPSEGVSFAPKLKKEASALNWALPAATLALHLRALQPWPVVTATLTSPAEGFKPVPLKLLAGYAAEGASPPKEAAAGQVLTVTPQGLCVAAGEGTVLCLTRLQPAGKGPMPAADWARNAVAPHLKAGTVLTLQAQGPSA
jgi:methionyl-tRNA formyltransferase